MKKLDKALEKINTALEREAVFFYTPEKEKPISWIPTWIPELDVILGGGIPRGRISEISGPFASGKTTLAVAIIASAQREGVATAFIDAEHTFSRSFAELFGVEANKLIFNRPDFGEQAIEIIESLIEADVGLIVVDSVDAMVPATMLENEPGQSVIGLHARLMSQMCRRLIGQLAEHNTALLLINQIRANINPFPGAPKETTSGGNAIKFYATIRMDIRRTGNIMEGKNVMGIKPRVRITKNKLAPPMKEVELLMFWDGRIEVK